MSALRAVLSPRSRDVAREDASSQNGAVASREANAAAETGSEQEELLHAYAASQMTRYGGTSAPGHPGYGSMPRRVVVML